MDGRNPWQKRPGYPTLCTDDRRLTGHAGTLDEVSPGESMAGIPGGYLGEEGPPVKVRGGEVPPRRCWPAKSRSSSTGVEREPEFPGPHSVVVEA